MRLDSLLYNINVLKKEHYRDDILVENLYIDSRNVKDNGLFFAVKGHVSDGHQFIDKAIEHGAVVIICETLPENLVNSVCYLQVEHVSRIIGVIASQFFGHPSKEMKVVGVTGTNGKTSTVSMLYQLFGLLGYKVGMLSTIEVKIGETFYDATHTTPHAIAIQNYMRQMVDAGCTHCFMEVSSHAIDQRRIEGIDFNGGVFTNLTHEHLDYHETFDAYLETKKRFFDDMPKDGFSLYNADSKYGEIMVQNTTSHKKSYAMKTTADYTIRIVESNLVFMTVYIDQKEVTLKVVGEFNAYNALACYAVARELGENTNDILLYLSKVMPAEGRLNAFRSPNGKAIGVVDYAHTPDAVSKVLTEVNKNKSKGKLITVIGCGGNRDKKKRPKMAQIAAQKSDRVILTSDNPRDEDPKTIIDDMKVGLAKDLKKKCLTIIDRKEAIRSACMLLDIDDIVAVLGKGREKYQEINGEKTPFDDKEVIWNEFKELNL